jgi:hypothetical protein
MDEPLPLGTYFEGIAADCDARRKHCFGKNSLYTRLHYALGLPTIALSALAGVAALQEQAPALIGASALGAAVLAGLQTFLRPDSSRAHYRECGIKYERLGEDAQLVLDQRLASLTDEEALRTLEHLRSRRYELIELSGSLRQ